MPRDTIILTVFNRPHLTLLNTVTALAYNDLPDTEILVVDDGSTEEYDAVWATADALKLPIRYARVDTAKDRPGTCQFDGHNNPAYVNNVALEMTAESERIYWLSSDVILPHRAIERARKWIDKGAIYSAKVLNMADGRVFCGREHLFPMMWFIGARREDCAAPDELSACGLPFDEEFLKGMAFEDCDYMGRLFQRVGKLVIDTAATAFHQSHPPAYMADGGSAYRVSEAYMAKKWGSRCPFSDNGRPFGWFMSQVGDFVIMTLDRTRQAASRGPVLAEEALR